MRDAIDEPEAPRGLTRLDDVRPRLPAWRWGLRLGMIVAVVSALGWALVKAEIQPGLLWEKRGNAATYLFGRGISDEDRAEARRQAERAPKIAALETARAEVRAGYAAQGKSLPDPVTVDRRVQARARELAAAMPAPERTALVESEYARILDRKRTGYFPPETDPERVRGYVAALLETLAIAVAGTALAVVASLPFALLAAPTTLAIIAPGDRWGTRVVRWVSCFVVRRLLDACRGFNEYVLALIIVAVIGLGPFAGVLALFVHTVGVLGKVFSEAIEAIEPGQVEGVASTGATPAQTISYAVLPQIMPYVVSNSLLRFETNVRSATILGFVGAGGIGFLMFDKISGYQFREVCTMMIIVIVAVTLIDFACGRLMKAVI